MDNNNLLELANKIRGKIVEMSHLTGAPHLGSALSCVDILVVLYSQILSIDRLNITNDTNDKFIFSKGHAAAALYATLAFEGLISMEQLATYTKEGTKLAEQPSPFSIPGLLEIATGSLGHGLPIASGMALASKIKNKNNKIFVLMSDGECNEGSVWEAALFAPAKKLNNLTVIIDYNKWQATGRSNETMALDSLSEKWRAFGWETFEIDGHDHNALKEAFSAPQSKPKVIVANTIKGKGISFMEDDNNWHYRIPTEEELNLAFKELNLR